MTFLVEPLAVGRYLTLFWFGAFFASGVAKYVYLAVINIVLVLIGTYIQYRNRNRMEEIK